MADVVLNMRAQIRDLQKGLKTTQGELKKLQTRSDQTNKRMQQNIQKTSRVTTELKSAITGVFAIGTAVALAKSIVNVRVEFEKFEAMLKVALGSAEAANKEFAKIQEFASNTPYSVRQLTDSFVRLVNQGFKPTQKEMRAMGDLSAAMGKDFMQLTEAIIDAQVGEFERLKEFGIRASKQGDEVSLSFKGIEKNVEFTEAAIRQAIIGFGEMEGVMGTMEEVSQTLGGQLSNLGDSLTMLANKLGEMTGDDVSNGIAVIKNLVDITSTFADLGGSDNETVRFIGKVRDGIAKWAPWLAPTQALRGGIEGLANVTGKASENLKEFVNTEEDIEEEIPEVDEEIKKEITSIDSLQKKIKKLTEEKKGLSAEDTVRLGQINRLIEAYKEQIEQIDKLGVAIEVKTPKIEDLELDDTDLLEGYYETQKEFKENFDQWYTNKERQRLADEEQLIIQSIDRQTQLQQDRIHMLSAGVDFLSSVLSENARAQKALAVAQAIINGALAITKVQAQTGVLSPPFIVATALQTAAQIATIRRQKFAGGHYEVLGGRRHAQGGVDIGIGEAEEGEGVAVFSREATKKYGEFIPAFVKAMNKKDAEIKGYGDKEYQVYMDDSRQVNKLEDIRKLLSKPSISYDRGYKIIERNGHITKVKI